jgi:hypothetical protein
MALALLLVAALACAAAGAHAATDSTRSQPRAPAPECIWETFTRHDNISAWEMQGQPHRHMIRDRAAAIRMIEATLERLSADSDSGVQWVPGSRWMSIFNEVGRFAFPSVA